MHLQLHIIIFKLFMFDSYNFVGILTNLKKGNCIANLFLLRKWLTILNFSINQFQEKFATLGNLVKIIKAVIKSVEDYRTVESFAQIWFEINTFATDNNIVIDIHFKV